MSSIIIIIITVTLMVSANALYVTAEFATVSGRKTRLTQMAGSGNRLAAMLLPYVEDNKALDNYIAACQVGITLSSLVLGAYGQNTVATMLSPVLANLGNLAEPVAFSISATGVLILLTVLQVVMGELLPKSVAIQYPEQLALATVLPMKWSLIIFRPFIWLLNGSGNLILRLIGIRQDTDHSHAHSPEEIELLVHESYKGGLLDNDAQQMLRNALRLRELTARQVMVPRTRMMAAPVESSVTELLSRACKEGFSRIPLYQPTIDEIVGFVHIKDLFRLHLQGQQNLAQILREVIYVPESLPIVDVWTTLNNNRQYIAIVFGEHGGTEGLISFEDLIEEIFGELQDEFDDELPLISYDQMGRIYLRSDLLVTDVNEYLNLDLPESEADTLGGLVFNKLGRLPFVGDEVTLGTPGSTIRVEAMEGRSVTELSLQLPADIPVPGSDMPRIGEWEIAEHD
jgi:CBS domain containing-hemolysin-like protein